MNTQRLSGLLPWLRGQLRQLATAAVILQLTGLPFASAAPDFPEPHIRNVLLIVVDDLNDWVSGFVEAPAITPHLEKLARQSTVFSRAYTASPSCGPSRTGFLTGIHPTRSGIHFNNQSLRSANTWVRDVITLPEHFMAHGWLSVSYGKVFHPPYDEEEIGRSWTNGLFTLAARGEDNQLREKLETEYALDSWPYFWGVLPDDWDRDDPAKMQQDRRNALAMADFLGTRHDRPFFAALGVYRPHTRWIAARRYFELYPIDEITPPPGYRAGDLNDLPASGRWMAEENITPFVRRNLEENNLWMHAIQAYLASTTFADEQIGMVLKALAAGPHAGDTVVIIFSDHGYHLGEKERFHKMALWERTLRVPLMVSLPEQRARNVGQAVDKPVSLLDVYPTLLALAGLPPPQTHHLDGRNLSPLLFQRKGFVATPVISTYGRGNFSIRDSRYRFIRYADGAEELYDLLLDPHEWTNLAADPSFGTVLKMLRSHLPGEEAPYTAFDQRRWLPWLEPRFFDFPSNPDPTTIP